MDSYFNDWNNWAYTLFNKRTKTDCEKIKTVPRPSQECFPSRLTTGSPQLFVDCRAGIAGLGLRIDRWHVVSDYQLSAKALVVLAHRSVRETKASGFFPECGIHICRQGMKQLPAINAGICSGIPSWHGRNQCCFPLWQNHVPHRTSPYRAHQIPLPAMR